MLAPTLPDLSQFDREQLRALLLAEHQERIATQEQLRQRDCEIETLKLLLSQLRRMQFGRKSEKLERQIEQLELRLEDLQQAQAAAQPAAESPSPETPPSTSKAKPVRRPLPEHLPRQIQTHVPKQSACPDCGGELRKLSEDVSEMLEYVPESFRVIRHVRPKLSCRQCERIVQAPAPSRPIARGLAGPGLLAHVLVSKYADHLPLHRQCEIYERQGIELERSTLADWVGGTCALLDPLVEALRRYVWRRASCMLTTRESRCWRRAWAKPRRGVCGRMCAMTDRRAIRPLRRYGLRTRPIAGVNIPGNICGRFRERYKRMPMPASISCMKMVGFRKLHVGRTFGANSTTWNKLTPRLCLKKLCNGSQLCMPLRMRFVDVRRTNANKFAKHELDLCSNPCANGSKSG
jgi:transposase